MHDAERFFDHHFAQRFTRAELTMLDDKAAAYAAEPTYRETLYELARRYELNDLGALLRHTGIGLFRPDAIAHGKVADVLSYLDRLGLRPVNVMAVPVAPQTYRDIWRYQLNKASGQRLRLLDLLFAASPSLLVIFQAGLTTPAVPCTVLMADVKGPADAEERQGWELRAFLDSPNRIEVYLHCGDEPADVVRDGGLLAGAAGFADMLFRQADPVAAKTVVALAHELAVSAQDDSPVPADPLFHSALGPLADAHLGRWQLLREVAGRCEMVAGEGATLISDSGIYQWWQQAGLLGDRHRYIAAATGWAGGELAAPLP